MHSLFTDYALACVDAIIQCLIMFNMFIQHDTLPRAIDKGLVLFMCDTLILKNKDIHYSLQKKSCSEPGMNTMILGEYNCNAVNTCICTQNVQK